MNLRRRGPPNIRSASRSSSHNGSKSLSENIAITQGNRTSALAPSPHVTLIKIRMHKIAAPYG
jgi:hypothetical protein